MELIQDDVWDKIESQLVKEYCKMLGISQESALYVITKASTIGMPLVTKAVTKMQQKNERFKQSLGLNMKELPVEIDLGVI